MWTCSVCDSKNEKNICICGFDRSSDYEKFPTLSPIPDNVNSAAALRSRRRKPGQKVCPACGSVNFHLFDAQPRIRCAVCSAAVKIEPLQFGLQHRAPHCRISAGETHTVAITKNGTAVSAGCGYFGGAFKILLAPFIITSLNTSYCSPSGTAPSLETLFSSRRNAR